MSFGLACCRVLIVMGLDVLGHADTVGNPQEYDKVVAGMVAQPPAAGLPQYMNEKGMAVQGPFYKSGPAHTPYILLAACDLLSHACNSYSAVLEYGAEAAIY